MNKNEKFVLVVVLLVAAAAIIATVVVVIQSKLLKHIVDIKNNLNYNKEVLNNSNEELFN